jgi:hypothetical protein
MPRIMIKCPKTGKAVPTGVILEEVAFEAALLPNSSFGPCPECGEMHSWSKEDAFFEDDLFATTLPLGDLTV